MGQLRASLFAGLRIECGTLRGCNRVADMVFEKERPESVSGGPGTHSSLGLTIDKAAVPWHGEKVQGKRAGHTLCIFYFPVDFEQLMVRSVG